MNTKKYLCVVLIVVLNLFMCLTSVQASGWINMPGHECSYKTVVTEEPTCTKSGKSVKMCSCGKIESGSEKTLSALGHSYGSWKTTKEHTCTEEGSKKQICTKCDTSNTATIKALGHDIKYRYIDSNNHEVYCSREGEKGCGYNSYKTSHSYAGGDSDVHYCKDCKKTANEVSDWAKYHYFDEVYGTCKFCKNVTNGIASTNFSNYPTWEKYYMIGAGNGKGTSWEKSLKTAEITFKYKLYSNKENTIFLQPELKIDKFVHGNWIHHAGIYSENKEDKTILDFPKKYIQLPMSEWNGEIYGQLKGVGEKEIEGKSKDKKTFEFTMPSSGHWRIEGFESWAPFNQLICNGNCDGDKPTEIPAFINVVYRDTNYNKLAGAPSDDRTKLTVWIDGATGKTKTVSADHTTLDALGWRYVRCDVYKTWDCPSKKGNTADTTKNSSYTVKPSLGDQRWTVVFVYEPIKLTINHVNSNGTLINTAKNGTIDLPKLIKSTKDPNHNCTSLGCTSGAHHITSFNKLIWPGYILEKYEISNSKETLATYTYNLYDEKADNATTRIPSSKENLSSGELKNVLQKDVLVSTKLSAKGEKTGYKSDRTITFTYSNIGINVKHKDYTTKELLKAKDGTTDLAYNDMLNGVSFAVPSLNTVGENTLLQKSVNYDISGYIIKEIKIYKGETQIGEAITEIGGTKLKELTYCILASSDETLTNYITEIKKIGNDVTIEFYYQKVPILTVKHQDDNGNMLARDEIIIMESGEVIAKPKDFSEDDYENDHYEDETGKHEPATEVKVINDGNNKTVIFVYKRNQPQIEKENEAKKVILRSNERGNEEYTVEDAIPTSEDLYANVITNSFVLKKALGLKEENQKLKLTLVQQYYQTSDTDEGAAPEDKVYAKTIDVTIDIPYEYYSASDVQLDILSKAIVKNVAIISKDSGKEIKDEVKVLPSYEQLPSLNYEKGGQIEFKSEGNNPVDTINSSNSSVASGFYDVEYLTDGTIKATLVLSGIEYSEPDMEAIKKQYTSNSYYVLNEVKKHSATVTMDKLSVTTDTGDTFMVLSGQKLNLGRTYTIAELKKVGYANLDAGEAPLIGENVLYRNEDIYVENVTKNGKYETTADIYYKPYQKVDENGMVVKTNGDEYKKDEYTQKGNDVKVHTPVVNYAKLELTENNKDNQLINSTGNVIVVGKSFTINMPNSGMHISSAGYGEKTYNYNGLKAKDEKETWVKENSFAMLKQVKFEFGVVYNGKYCEKGEWINLDIATENFEFIIPTWEDEVWDNKTVKIYTRVVAENAEENDYSKEETGANKDTAKYVAIKKFDVKIVGRMYDIQIRATNDTGWQQFKDGKALVTSQFPVGQAGQNASTAYKYGLKLGAKVFFDLKVDGGYGQTSDTIVATPKYYYVSKDGGSAKEVDVYYHTTSEKYVKMSDKPIALTTKMTQNNGAKYFANYTTNLGLTSQINGKTYDYTANNSVGTSSKILLKNFTRIVAYKTPDELIEGCKYYPNDKISNITNLASNTVINSIGRWYGEFKVPASAIIAKKDTTLENVKKGQTLKDGYLIVAFESLKTQSSDEEYLTYENQWSKEGYENEITLPNGSTGKLPDDSLHAMAIYETTLKINNDYEGTGTH